MSEGISFTKKVKEELVNNTYESEAKLKAILSSYIRIIGVLIFSKNKSSLIMKTENPQIAKFIYSKLTDLFQNDIHLDFIKGKKNKNKITYQIRVDNDADKIIEDLKIDFLEGKISKEIVYNDQTISGYLIGTFLASGSVNSPYTSNYHLELSLNNDNYAKWLAKLFPRYRGHKIEPKLITRRNKFIIYFKKSDQIANFLAMIGANESCTEYESIRIDRDFMNTTNRLANFDTANMRRTINTAKRQIEEIEAIEECLGLTHFHNQKCAMLCELRKEYESYSMDDLAKQMSNITGEKITKSNINHLFRQIHNLYLKISSKKRMIK